MAIVTHTRQASVDEIAAEMDRRGHVIEELEKKLDHAIACEAEAAEINEGLTVIIREWRERCERAENNRDMWKGQSERQAEELSSVRYHLAETLDALEAIDSEIVLTGHLKELVDCSLAVRRGRSDG